MARLSTTVGGKTYTMNLPNWTNKLAITVHAGLHEYQTNVEGAVALLPQLSECDIRIFAGTYPDMELFAFKRQGEGVFYGKTTLCNHCGECCRNMSQKWIYGLNEAGDCIHLSNNLCAKPGGPPVHCLGGFEEFPSPELAAICSIKYGISVVGV
uniref:Uncharacterized protein n=1 Tax=viral metagenome TaxID=1070528 RepID=A0A6M3KLQ8_9ZZZZ